ncbi:PP2C family serine/threonine-protein phosphatase [[Kitasatospora] papulosa]|uniref:mucin-2 n=1 Tax=[Kitasatospora] papulosa TaxID=1464011 RepID=UPI0036C2082B
MRTYATAQQTGTDPVQCDATAVHTAPSGARAYVLLDGIGRSQGIREWTRTAARQVARAASRRGDAEAGLRHVYNRYAAERAVHGSGPKAAAVVVVTAPGKPTTIAWCGDSRAYSIRHGVAHQLTADHNLRRVYPPCTVFPEGGNRNRITSCLGSTATDQDVMNVYGHPAIEATTCHADTHRLVLASDGAYEPHADAGRDLASELVGLPGEAARAFTASAVHRAAATTRALDPNRAYADNATVLVADIRP